MVPTTSGWELTPRQSIEIECARRGRDQVVAGCVALLQRHEVDDNLVIALGGPMSQIVLDDGPGRPTSTGDGSGGPGDSCTVTTTRPRRP